MGLRERKGEKERKREGEESEREKVEYSTLLHGATMCINIQKKRQRKETIMNPCCSLTRFPLSSIAGVLNPKLDVMHDFCSGSFRENYAPL